MTIRSPEVLKRCIELAVTNPNLDHVSKQIGAGRVTTVYTWMRESAAHADRGLESQSPYWIDIEPDGPDFWHRHLLRARAASVLRMSGIIQDQVTNGIEETVFNPQTGRPLQ